MRMARNGLCAVLACFCLMGQAAVADTAFDSRFNTLQTAWQDAYYLAPAREKADRLEALLGVAEQLHNDYPQRAESWIVHAIVLCVYSGVSWGFDALSNIDKARQYLLKAKDMDPTAMEGASYITLGALYYQVPGWPISFGDDDQAREYLQKAVQLFPDALDSNYFYGDFLAGQDEYAQAYRYLVKAEQAPIRASLGVSDRQLKRDLADLLRKVRKHLPDNWAQGHDGQP
jgi:tetratricopeptide (TPR) repeat protein